MAVTDSDARLLALDRSSGELLWRRRWRTGGRTTARRLRRWLSAAWSSPASPVATRAFAGSPSVYDQATGREMWRFWTVPRPRRTGIRDVARHPLEHGCASTWLTGTYDSGSRHAVLADRQPRVPITTAAKRLGYNPHSDSILALDPATGRLKWHFQFTPHDVWDWHAQQPPVLVDALWGGQAHQCCCTPTGTVSPTLDRVMGVAPRRCRL